MWFDAFTFDVFKIRENDERLCSSCQCNLKIAHGTEQSKTIGGLYCGDHDNCFFIALKAISAAHFDSFEISIFPEIGEKMLNQWLQDSDR